MKFTADRPFADAQERISILMMKELRATIQDSNRHQKILDRRGSQSKGGRAAEGASLQQLSNQTSTR